jgi:hypothetical protein
MGVTRFVHPGTLADANGYFSVDRPNGGTGVLAVGDWLGGGSGTLMVSGTLFSTAIDMNQQGDHSVSLPNNSISAAEELEEPGIAHVNVASTSVPASYGALTSRSISCPAPGYVVAIGSVDLQITHASGTTDNVGIGVSTSATSLPAQQDFQAQLPSVLPGGTYDETITAHGVFSVSAGATTIYLVGVRYVGNVATAYDENLTLMYFPTAYGSVSPPAPARPPTAADANADDVPMAPLSAADIAAEQADARRFDAARLQGELEAMRVRMDALRRDLERVSAAQASAAAPPRK